MYARLARHTSWRMNAALRTVVGAARDQARKGAVGLAVSGVALTVALAAAAPASCDKPPALPSAATSPSSPVDGSAADAVRWTLPEFQRLVRPVAAALRVSQGLPLVAQPPPPASAGAPGSSGAAVPTPFLALWARSEPLGYELLLAAPGNKSVEAEDAVQLVHHALQQAYGPLHQSADSAALPGISVYTIPSGKLVVDARMWPNSIEVSWKPLGDVRSATERGAQPAAPDSDSPHAAAMSTTQPWLSPDVQGASPAVGLSSRDAVAAAHAFAAALLISGSGGAASASSPSLPQLQHSLTDLVARVHVLEVLEAGVLSMLAERMQAAITAGRSSAGGGSGRTSMGRRRIPFSSPRTDTSDASTSSVDEEDVEEAAAGAGSQMNSKASRLDPRKQPLAFLRSMGIKYYAAPTSSSSTTSGEADSAATTANKPGVPTGPDEGPLDWSALAGADKIRHQIEDNVLLPLSHPEMFDAVTKQTRARTETNRFGAYLFSGPPGVGKTSAARIVSTLVNRPLVSLNFTSIGSPYHSQSENNLARVLQAVSALPGAILFIDEAESMFPSRFSSSGRAAASGGVSEAIGHKMLSQLLTWLEGMEGNARNTLILATNKAEDLDPALLSRCSSSVQFELPDKAARADIWRLYARHLSSDALARLAEVSDGFSGRDIKRCAEVTERRHVADLQRSGVTDAAAVTPPPETAYATAVEERAEGVLSIESSAGGGGGGVRRPKKQHDYKKWREEHGARV